MLILNLATTDSVQIREGIETLDVKLDNLEGRILKVLGRYEEETKKAFKRMEENIGKMMGMMARLEVCS